MTPEKCKAHCSWYQDTSYSEPEAVIFSLNKPNILKCKKYFIFWKSQFWFFVTWSASFESKLKSWSVSKFCTIFSHVEFHWTFKVFRQQRFLSKVNTCQMKLKFFLFNGFVQLSKTLGHWNKEGLLFQSFKTRLGHSEMGWLQIN